MFKSILAIVLILATAIVFAEEKKEEGGAGEVILYPAKVVKEGAEVAIEAGKNVVETVGGTVEGVVTGDVEKAVTTPVTGTAEAVVDVVGGTVTAPIDATKTEEEELHKEELPGGEAEVEEAVPLAEEVTEGSDIGI